MMFIFFYGIFFYYTAIRVSPHGMGEPINLARCCKNCLQNGVRKERLSLKRLFLCFHFLKDGTIQFLQYPDRLIEPPAIGDVLLCGYTPDETTGDVTHIRNNPLEKTGIEGMLNIIRENRSASYGKFYFTG
jgi:hypothetical protein